MSRTPFRLAITTMLTLLTYPDPRLHIIAAPVTAFDNSLLLFVAQMAEAMYDAGGVGLSATQVNVHKRVFITDLSSDRSDLRVFVNPEIVWVAPNLMSADEGCLSVPGVYETTKRAQQLRIRAADAKGEVFELFAEGQLAQCIQHEFDHLSGRVFIDNLSPLKRGRIRARLAKDARRARGRP